MQRIQAAIIVAALPVDLSYCVVNTNGREFLRACLAAIEATHPVGVEREILVLDNASTDGSAAAVRALGGDVELIERERPHGKLENDPTAAAATPQLLDANAAPYPCAWRYPGVGTALLGALFLHRWTTAQST